jgi:hypothetical protein
VSVGMAAVAVSAVSVIVEKEETHDVRCQSKGADNEHEFWLRDFLWFDESLDRFQEDGETQRDKEHTVDERT